jgi:flagellar biosynthesis anti-sigma factor FlgM
MSSSISTISPGSAIADASSEAQGSAGARPVAAAPAPAAIAASSGEAVTLSADAQTTTQLLDAARASDGIDQAAVQQTQGAIQNGTYNVSPENLARAIFGALKETSS